MLHVYTDGACSGNGKAISNGGYGICATDANGDIVKLIRKSCDNTTNNREELKAIWHALLWIGDREATIYSDSAYSLNTIQTWMYSWASKGWIKSDKKTPENLDIIKPIYEHMMFRANIKFVKVKGHAGHVHNEIADALAADNKPKLKRLLEEQRVGIEPTEENLTWY